MRQQVRTILSRIGHKGRETIAHWQELPNRKAWFVEGFVQVLGEGHRTAATWIAEQLDREQGLAQLLARGLASDTELTIGLFEQCVPDGSPSPLSTDTATLAQLQDTIRKLEKRICDVEALLRSGSPSTTGAAAKTLKLILDTLGYQSLNEIRSKVQRERIEQCANDVDWIGMDDRQIINKTMTAINEGYLKPKKGG